MLIQRVALAKRQMNEAPMQKRSQNNSHSATEKTKEGKRKECKH